MVVYKIDIIKELKKAGFNTNKIRQEKLLSEITMTHIRRGEMISLPTLNNICLMLRCTPNDVIEIVPTDEEKLKFF